MNEPRGVVRQKREILWYVQMFDEWTKRRDKTKARGLKLHNFPENEKAFQMDTEFNV